MKDEILSYLGLGRDSKEPRKVSIVNLIDLFSSSSMFFKDILPINPVPSQVPAPNRFSLGFSLFLEVRSTFLVNSYTQSIQSSFHKNWKNIEKSGWMTPGKKNLENWGKLRKN